MSRYPLLTTLPGLLFFFCGFTAAAEPNNIISLNANAHVCNSKDETARLAINPQLQEMARALVEFKPTKFCFILPDAAEVVLLQQHSGFIEFDYKSQVLYTFSHYVVERALTANSH
ncbi:MAG: hypothetical protein KKE30_01350 [Gammaproteobacteria bacterium]|nr:hypothetical protein [Gammaproteobacteria bacterium]MBU1557221.1 hypothetical protein [Gammaproteobacteria bacterium]MBU2072156.1 hypothetical protein [Gammaproteobacteria bacterium]MBU2182018.1 hypothetical protein [Gammaproteobacteria bacterium]MBU2203861.1 hypothetical protein [Gammaproteobacteria bacterium]